jgi:hypothetical protein
MENRKDRSSSFLRDRMADCLTAQARICARIASECWSEEIASKFEGRARKCNEAARAKEGVTIRAVWPTQQHGKTSDD